MSRCLFAVALTLSLSLPATAAPRNVVLLVADDLGLQVGCYGDAAARTPNIDALAKSGTRFTHAFASVASCSPSRATILTGLPTHANGQYGLAHATQAGGGIGRERRNGHAPGVARAAARGKAPASLRT